MNPILLYFLPVLMLISYYLTLLQYKKRKEIYSQHYDFDTISLLNPSLAKQISKGRISKKYLIRIILLTILIIFLATTSDSQSFTKSKALEFLIGFSYITYTLIVSRILHNLALYRYLAKNPQEISGKIHLKTPLVMFQGILEFTTFLAVIIVWVILSPSVFGYGALTTIIILIVQLLRYFYKSKKKSKDSYYLI